MPAAAPTKECLGLAVGVLPVGCVRTSMHQGLPSKSGTASTAAPTMDTCMHHERTGTYIIAVSMTLRAAVGTGWFEY
jgi:hypothetical protein